MRRFFVFFLLLVAAPAQAVDFPPLSGRVVDQADLLTPEQEQQLDGRLEALQRASSRQLVVATISSLQDLTIEDYGYQLGRHWQIGQRGANNGVLLIVAPNERKMRIEIGYGLEGVMTDALSSRIIRETIAPFFQREPPDYAGGIFAGADAIIAQLQAPPEAAEREALAAQQAENQRQSRRGGDGDGSIAPLIFWGVVLLFILLPAFGAGLAGRRYRGRGRRGVSIWGPGTSRGRGSGLGWFIAGVALDSLARGGRRSGGSWGGGGGGWGGGGGGGFSGGGGSFGGGGASGGW